MLRVTLFDSALEELEPLEVSYVSHVSGETWGPPALVAPNPKNPNAKRAEPGEQVLYINTSVTPAWIIEEMAA